MNVKIPNGTTVHRSWKDEVTTELIAAFQYASDAEEWAKRHLENQNENVSLIIVNHDNATVWRFVKNAHGTLEANDETG